MDINEELSLKWWNTFNPDTAYIKGMYLNLCIEHYFPNKTIRNITNSEIEIIWWIETEKEPNDKPIVIYMDTEHGMCEMHDPINN